MMQALSPQPRLRKEMPMIAYFFVMVSSVRASSSTGVN